MRDAAGVNAQLKNTRLLTILLRSSTYINKKSNIFNTSSLVKPKSESAKRGTARWRQEGGTATSCTTPAAGVGQRRKSESRTEKKSRKQKTIYCKQRQKSSPTRTCCCLHHRVGAFLLPTLSRFLFLQGLQVCVLSVSYCILQVEMFVYCQYSIILDIYIVNLS